ncbi:hypothetical protein ENBRE01_0626 [Enteropsectra breve]|nr:hypothetical protein ENBRE01_0626 [Enteropsectra breve]
MMQSTSRMINLLLCCYLYPAKSLGIDDFKNQDTRIFMSSANHIYLGVNSKDDSLTARSKYEQLSGIKTRLRIVPYENEFIIGTRDSEPLCPHGSSIQICKTKAKWAVNQRPMGYTISTGTKCITLTEKYIVRLMPCVESSDQMFDFQLADNYQVGGDIKPEKFHPLHISIDHEAKSHKHYKKHGQTHKKKRMQTFGGEKEDSDSSAADSETESHSDTEDSEAQ